MGDIAESPADRDAINNNPTQDFTFLLLTLPLSLLLYIDFICESVTNNVAGQFHG
ncbi:hypothetical protein ACTJKN_07200 [Pedobacter sp. 22163]|uniref:hypothetical protein n=1 Tax=Pedobacter sp. 22163 TaxID=3453883 RepID=UPI003F85A22C